MAPNIDHLHEETEPPTQDQTLQEQRIVTFDNTIEQDTQSQIHQQREAATNRQQERVEEPSPALAEVLAKLKTLEKAKGKISAQVAAKQKAASRRQMQVSRDAS
jgi:allophanate hydrolase subunit 1